MNHEPLTNRSGVVPDLAYARGAGSREQGGSSREVGSHAFVSHHGHAARSVATQPQPMHGSLRSLIEVAG